MLKIKYALPVAALSLSYMGRSTPPFLLVPKVKVVIQTDQWTPEHKQILIEEIQKGNIRSQDLDFSNSDLEGIDFSGVPLEGACFDRCDLRIINFENTNLRGASFKEAKLYGVNFKGADLTGANFKGSNISTFYASMSQKNNYTNLAPYDTNFRSANLKNANFQYVGIYCDCDFTSAILENTNFNEVRFSRTEKLEIIEKIRSQLVGTNFSCFKGGYI